MKEKDVPQDKLEYYLGHKRACYAIDSNGNYKMVTSAGWSTEEIVNAQAVELVESQIEVTKRAVLDGKLSALAYHMAVRQMTPRILASTLGLWTTWKVRRMLNPKRFDRAPREVLKLYAEALGVTAEEIRRLPLAREEAK